MTRLDPLQVAAGNTPRHTVNKKAIATGPRQAGLLVRGIMLPEGIDFLSCAEAHTAFYEPIREDYPRIGVTLARPNDVFPNTRLRNALLTNVSGQGWARQDRRNLNMPWAAKPDGLNMVASLAQRRSDGYQCTGVVCHFPAARDASDAVWDRMVGQLGLYVSRIDGPVWVSADWNRGEQKVARALPDLEPAAWDQVMGVMVRGFKVKGQRVIQRGYHPKVSDHPGLPVATLIPQDTRRIAKLPR